MARAHRVALLATITTVAYLLLFFNMLSVPLLDAKIAGQILPVIPWWLLVTFGSYCLWSIGMGLVTLRECPEAYNELLGEITEAKDDLRTKGVTVD
ncbi:dolichol-phosphate mannosyltransferase subunit 3 [Phlegmacium glaucopus]|nr:dolichol-phosphate mannosyltransferase subunit 3 [Phlegmacium glaucopus]